MEPLASMTDVSGVLKRKLTEQEEQGCGELLAAASEMFRSEARQQFTPGGSIARLRIRGGRVRLDQMPATAVESVFDDDGHAVGFRWSSELPQWVVINRDRLAFATVSYEHGSAAVPPMVRSAVAAMVARSLVMPEEILAGARQLSESVGQRSVSVAWSSEGAPSGVFLSAVERAVAHSYHWKGGRAVVCRP